jgi:nucleoside-diphosphate kinase
MERTLVLIKPDAMHRGLAGEIIARLERRGLRIAGMRMLHMDEALARRHYAEHEGKPFLEGLVRYITACPLIAAVFEGTRAVEMVRQAMEIGRNLVHGSDSLESAEREIQLFFEEEQLFGYQRSIDPWVYEEGR